MMETKTLDIILFLQAFKFRLKNLRCQLKVWKVAHDFQNSKLFRTYMNKSVSKKGRPGKAS